MSPPIKAPGATQDLTQEFRTQTRGIHSISDALVNARLVFLLADRTLYGRALTCFYLVHKQLDMSLHAAAVSTSNTDLKAFVPLLTEAARTSAFEADMAFFLGPDWGTQLVRTPAVEAYVSHLQHLEDTAPLALLAHAYTQHMALLAGGRLLAASVAKGMGLQAGGAGTAAFTFPPRDRTGRGLRGDYKDALNKLGRELDAPTRSLLLAEHAKAFELNNAVIREFHIGLQRPLLGSIRLVCQTWWIAAPLALGLAYTVARYSSLLPANS
ncbi:HMOX2 [Auxenochlorella protothecoides x Auxenochlorella symbiontica]